VIGFIPGTIVSPTPDFTLNNSVNAVRIISTPGEDQLLVDPAITTFVNAVGYYNTTAGTIPAFAGRYGGIEIAQFVTPNGIGSLLWVDRGNFSGLDGGDTIIAWVEGALVTPADIVFGVSDLPASPSVVLPGGVK